MENYIRTLAGDLLNMEVSTIIKENTTNAKMPSKRRVALHDIAERYRLKLIELGLCTYDLDQPKGKIPLQWRFGGEFSFVEIYAATSKGVDSLQAKLKREKKEDAKEAIEQKLRLLTRFQRQASNLIGMFKLLRGDASKKIENEEDGYLSHAIKAESKTEEHPSQMESNCWNNDISLQDINKVEDLPLTPEHLTLIRKTWEVGTEQIVLQTVMQIDGDVTSYVTNNFVKMHEDTQKVLLGIHQDAVQTSVRSWNVLFNTLAKLAGRAIDKVFS